MSPEISIIVTSYNHAKYVRSCLLSILNESLPGMEVIVVDDASTDGTVDRLQDLPIRLISNPINRGIPYCRNLGLQYASGELITFFDSDNILLPGGLSSRVSWLKAHDNENIVGGMGGGFIDEGGKPLMGLAECRPPDRLSLELLRQGEKYCCAVWLFLFRKRLLEHFRFDESLKAVDDCELMLRILHTTSIPIIPNPVAAFRIHDGNTSIQVRNGRVSHPPKVLAEALLVNLAHGIVPKSLQIC